MVSFGTVNKPFVSGFLGIFRVRFAPGVLQVFMVMVQLHVEVCLKLMDVGALDNMSSTSNPAM